MKLLDIFEQESPSPLQPGEKRERKDISIRDLRAIDAKLSNLQDSLHDSEYLKYKFAQDKALQDALAALQKRVELKISYMTKLKDRPTAGESKAMEILERECSDWLEITRRYKKFLYRGMRSDVSVFEGKSWQDRQVQTSNPELAKKFDEVMAAAGFQALKSNSIATTTDYHFAANYGWNVYIIFPKNGFHLLTTEYRDLSLHNVASLGDKDKLEDFAQELQLFMAANVDDWKWTDLGYDVRYRNWSSMFDRLHSEFEYKDNPYKLPDKFNVKIDAFVNDQGILDSFKPTSTDITDSMRYGYEILINGEYWAFDRRIWENFLHKKIWPGSSYYD